MGGTYGVPCPTLDIGTISFPWTGSVTSSDPTSGLESRDHQDVAEPGCDAVVSSPETVMAATETPRDPALAQEDGGKSAETRVRSSDESPPAVAANTSLPAWSPYGVVTSQPQPEVEIKPEVLTKSGIVTEPVVVMKPEVIIEPDVLLDTFPGGQV